MSIQTALSQEISRTTIGSRHPNQSMRVAVICDFLEERWPSMELLGDMLFSHLGSQSDDRLDITQIRPPMRLRFTRVPIFPQKTARSADRLINRFIDYPNRLRDRRGDFDIFHVVDHSYGQLLFRLPVERTIVTCHDLDTFRCLLEPDRDKRPGWFRSMTGRILTGFLRAAHVIAVSGATRDELIKHRLFSEDRITVIPNGVHPSCSPSPNSAADHRASELIPAATAGPLLLSVGNTLPRKRLDVLLRVFAEVRRAVPNARLVRAGDFTAEQLRLAAELGIEDSIVQLSFLDRDVLAAVYRRATLLLHTAEAEGFGLPLIEAMACGCPVVASDIPVLREVGGMAAEYCPVAGVDAWSHTVIDLLQRRTQADSWKLRCQQAIARASRFSWFENARQTAIVYQKVMKKNDLDHQVANID